ncbi:ATP-binding response regulator [Vibrio astriarenae]|uniref:ATP-binding response regulator n=1 Tax=Vibrio astriarenae TaxID=1481923 RepID=UPI003736237E
MDAVRKVYHYAQPNLTLISWLGMAGFPLYYIVWEYLFPQQYENLALRLLCSGLFALVLLREKLPSQLQRYNPVIYQIAITTGLPFFFFFMLLMNDWAYVWVMSYMSATFLHILLVHMTRVVFAQAIVAISSAFFFAWIAKGHPTEILIEWPNVPIFLFVYVFGNFCYSRNQDEHESRASLAKTFGAGIAHEMRNPLSCLCTSIDVIQSTLPQAEKRGQKGYYLSEDDVSMMKEVSAEAMKIIQSGNETIDLLLTSIDENRVSRSTFKRYSAQSVVSDAVESFSYKGEVDKRVISLDVHENFPFIGSDTLLKYVMYNLFKNAFHHRKAEPLKIDVSLFCDEQGHHIEVKDNGNGIPRETVKHIYEDFYTTGKKGSYGLGLPFCRRVMRSFGGEIQCHSALGEGTTFTLSFPPRYSEKGRKIVHEITSIKSTLTISDRAKISARTWLHAAKFGFKPQIISIKEAVQLREHEFEYDLIAIDLASEALTKDKLTSLESQLTLTEARIVYIYDSQDNQHLGQRISNHICLRLSECSYKAYDLFEALLLEPDFSMQSPVLAKAQPSGKRKVLLVDDNLSLRKLTKILLEKLGFEVIERENGQQALEALDQQMIDVVLMDIEMPIMDGIEATQRIRQSNQPYSQVPIIAHTGDSSLGTLEKIELSGMTDYIVKPADVNRLVEKLNVAN